VLPDRIAKFEVEPEITDRIERRRERKRVPELILTVGQILQHREVVARARLDRARNAARSLQRRDVDLDVDAKRDVRWLILPGTERGICRGPELRVGR
jgi:hypothetical protein